MHVTFDTNVLDLACRPERFPKDPRQPALGKVRDALRAGTASDTQRSTRPNGYTARKGHATSWSLSRIQ